MKLFRQEFLRTPIPLVFCVASLFILSSCNSTIDLSNAKMAESHQEIVVDGYSRSSKDEWKGAIESEFSKYGHASFLWGEKGIYCLIGDNTLQSPFSPEAMVLSFYSQRAQVRIFFDGFTIGTGPAEHRINFGWLNLTKDETPPDKSLIKIKSRMEPSQFARYTPWIAECFIPWEVLLVDSKDKKEVTAEIAYLRLHKNRTLILKQKGNK